MLTPGNFSIGGGFQWGKRKYYRDGTVPDEFVLRLGDLLVTMTDLSKGVETLGYSAVVPESDFRLLHNQRLGRVIKKSELIDLGYIHWLLRTPDYRNEILASYTGSTVKHTSPKKILAYQFLRPPLQEQQQVVAVLDSLEHKIELNRRMNEMLEAMARAIFRDWFVDFGPTRAKAEGRAPYLGAEIWDLFPDAVDDNGLPRGWEEQPFVSFLDIIGGGTPKTQVAEYWIGEIPWFSVVDTPSKGGVFVRSTEKTISGKGLAESSARLIPAGTTIITARGTVGKMAMAARNMTFNQSCYALRARAPVGDRFVYFATERMVERLQAMAHGSVFSTITRATFRSLTFPWVGERLFEEFEELLDPIFSKIKANGEENETLSATRDLLLPKLMTGEIRLNRAEEALETAT